MKTLLIGLLMALPAAQAHRPSAADLSLDVADPTISWVVAGVFASGDEVYTVNLTYETGFALPFEIMSPRQAGMEDHRPAYAVVGPGLPAPSDADRDYLPFEVEDGLGVYIERNEQAAREVYFEQVLRRTLYTSGTIALPLQAGESQVWIWSPEGTTGDWQLGFGVEEDFSNGGFGAIFDDWSLYAW